MDQIKPPDLASPRFKANPYPFYARLRAEAPVYRTTVPVPHRQPAWLVTRYGDVLTVLKDDRFANDWSPKMLWLLRWGFAKALMGNMVSRDPPDHTRLRTLVQKAFTPRRIERLRERIQSVCDDLLDAAAPNGRMELVRGYALPFPVTIIADLLGIPPQDRLRFQSWTGSIVESSSGSATDVLRALPNIWFFLRYLRKLFAQRRAEPQDDLVTALVQAEEAGDRLNEDELLAIVFLLLVAGYESTVSLIASGTLALIQDPEQRNRFEQNPALAESAIEELLRYTSPLDISTPRLMREEVRIGSVTIPPGELVLAVLGSANHDESQFPDPETLDLTREPNQHLAFGQGAHFCLGASLASLEGQIALTTLFRRFPNLRLAEAPESLHWRKGLFLRGLEQLPVSF
ncbi:cytochrome P450 [Acidobacteriia bacterium AH_259_A11_L15]|nr:cytochrome P450 [Acidobacteriia bacterium AH_259_A11_L15]